MSVREVETPQMGPHDVMIEVAAAGVTVADILLRKGLYPIGESETAIPGLEVAGVVRRIGREVTSWRPGDPICSIVSGGGYAELAIVPAEHCLPVPSHWSMTDAASAVGPICTAWFNVAMLGRLAVGESLLVHGGSGGVGSWAVQIFGARGHPIYATAGGAARCERIEALGATRCFDHQVGAFDKALFATTENQGVDVVLDILGAQALEANLRVLKEGGRLVGIATQQGAKASVDLWTLYRRRLSLTGSALRAQTRRTKKEIVAAVLANVWPVILQRRIASVVDSVYPFDQAVEAQDRLERGGNFGKVVLQIKE
ncbi:zinc-binding dehydrogenase (plasmid) [Variovorax paradoxus]|nr:zinc-binding dehydrogenase [Variovorax paradoxus]